MKSVIYTNLDSQRPNLIIKGQGTVATKCDKFSRSISFSILEGDGANNLLTLSIFHKSVQIYRKVNGSAFILSDKDYSLKDDAFLENDTEVQYWFSLDSKNGKIKYGKGEVRDGTCLLEYDCNPSWFKDVNSVTLESCSAIKVFKDPVTFDPPLYVVPSSQITMDDVASFSRTTPANLNSSCQKLYDTVSGFILNTPDFPNFSEAIEKSIKNPNGWCFKKLKEKSTEFGSNNPKQTYLRITLGQDFGESPGIPYVMEIWPPGHYSPIHNHANANAIIKVLHGDITVNLYPHLSSTAKPFNVATFHKDEVTWISPTLNQTHQLRNTNVIGDTCITIQCYMYGDEDNQHYEYFDYLNQTAVEQFYPNSDMDFISFKNLMKLEYNQY